MKSAVSPVPPFGLAMQHLPLVEAAVVRVSRQVGGPLDWNQLIAIGALALHDAASRYHSSRPVGFATHARRCIRGAILDSLRKQIQASRRPRWRPVRDPVKTPRVSRSTSSETEPGAEYSRTLVHLRKLLLDTSCIREAS